MTITRVSPAHGREIIAASDLEQLLNEDFDAATASLLAGIKPPNVIRNKKDSTLEELTIVEDNSETNLNRIHSIDSSKFKQTGDVTESLNISTNNKLKPDQLGTIISNASDKNTNNNESKILDIKSDVLLSTDEKVDQYINNEFSSTQNSQFGQNLPIKFEQ